jgi:sugar phosphate permease
MEKDPEIKFVIYLKFKLKTKARSGQLIGVGIGTYLFGKFFNGYLTDKIGGNNSLLLTMLIIVVGTVWFASNSQFFVFLMAWGLIKFGQSCAWISMTKIGNH